jgi:hypothetical protein
MVSGPLYVAPALPADSAVKLHIPGAPRCCDFGVTALVLVAGVEEIGLK